MVLMDTALDLIPPNTATTEFIWVSSFCHENITIFEMILFNVFWQHLDGLDFQQVQVSILYVSHAQIGNLDSLFTTELSALCNAGSNISELTERGYFEPSEIFPWIAEHRDEGRG